jgi:hypothetical protein
VETLKITKQLKERKSITSQDFIKFWGNFFASALLELIDFSQGFKTFEYV